jgi:uncharacterized protein
MDKKAQIKEAIRQLHSGVPPEEVKEKFREVFESTNALEFARIEDEMLKEERGNLSDVNMSLSKETEKQNLSLEPNQPISILMEEHKIMSRMVENLVAAANKIVKGNDLRYVEADIRQIEHLMADFQDAEKHYLREENVLFPMLEKHGVSELPSIMWMEHEQIREAKKRLQEIIGKSDKSNFQAFKWELADAAKVLGNLLPIHFNKENNSLFPAALSAVTEEEWVEIRKEFDNIGYCCFTPPKLTGKPKPETVEPPVAPPAEVVQFENGALNKLQLEAVLNTVPVEITYIDENDTVCYFNKPEKTIFVRTKAIIGRKVQNCHPQKSLGTVTKIVESFKSGRKNVAEFWINLNGRVIYIRFFAVRSPQGKYMGAMEVVQDITEAQKLQGERRLLNWEE